MLISEKSLQKCLAWVYNVIYYPFVSFFLLKWPSLKFWLNYLDSKGNLNSYSCLNASPESYQESFGLPVSKGAQLGLLHEVFWNFCWYISTQTLMKSIKDLKWAVLMGLQAGTPALRCRSLQVHCLGAQNLNRVLQAKNTSRFWHKDSWLFRWPDSIYNSLWYDFYLSLYIEQWFNSHKPHSTDE